MVGNMEGRIGGYEIREEIGRGGYAIVYRAFQPAIEREVAIKVILPEHITQTDFKRRFEVEAQLVAQLEHPYIIPLYDFWQTEEGAFLVMRWLRGGSLRDLLEKQGRLTLKQAMRFYDQISEALSVAHQAQVIHRDIKPDNVLIDQYGNAYLSDFGIAKNLAIDTNITGDEDFVGTPAYLSPEQIKGEQVSPQTDIYALGIMLYELLVGQPPFPRSMQIFYSHLEVPVPPTRAEIPDLPEAIDVVIAQATAKDPERRFANALDMAAALREAIIPSPQAAPILPVQEQPKTIDPTRHVFVSYSRQDSAFVYRLAYDLQAEGVPVWLDKQGLKPGTRNWEDSLRGAIQSAYAVVLIASPESRRSNYVQDELAIAQMYNCPVYAVWAAGEQWIDSIAMGWGGLQYLDARGDNYDLMLPELVTSLGGRLRSGEEQATVTDLPESFAPRNPYKGLRAFQQSDQDDFFGRSTLVSELLGMVSGNMQRSRFLPVIGPSGSGKSSVVMAGLLPALQRGALTGSESWVYLPPIVPGVDPIENLTIALASQLPEQNHATIREDLFSTRGLHILARQIAIRRERGGQGQTPVVLYVDQFEELFTQTTNEDLRQHFIDLLLTAAEEPGGSVIVIITLRADFYDRPMNYPELGKLVESNSKVVLPMSLADLYDVVQKPARLPDVMLLFDPGLVAEMVFEVRDQVGGLPLLQFTLDQLFERRDGRRLTYDSYRQIGGLRGALAKHAEETFTNLPSDQHRAMARALFLRLIEPGSTEQDTTRRRAPLNELILADAGQTRIMRGAADAFVDARLLFTDQNTIEVSHEALIREWPRLRVWLDEARVDIDLQQTLSADTENWVLRGRKPDDDGLYRGTLLENAQAWAARNVPNADEMAFLNASASQQAAERARDEAIARRVQNFGRAALVLGIVGVVAVILTVFAFVQSQAANTARQSAEEQQQTSVAREGVANTQVAQAGETLTPIPQTLTPVGATLAAGQAQLSTAQVAIAGANQLAERAQTQVADAQNTLTPIPLTLTPIQQTLVAGDQRLSTAQSQVIEAGELAEGARTQVAQAQEQVAVSGLTLTPIPLTLTPVALTLAAGDQQLATAVSQIGLANQLADSAQTQVALAATSQDEARAEAFSAQTQAAQAGLTLTPVPLTLTPAAQALIEAGEQARSAQTQVAESNEQAQSAQTQVAAAGLTLTPVPLTLTPAAQALIEAGEQARSAQTQVAQAQEQVAVSGMTLTPVPLTLTPIAVTLAAAQAQVTEVSILANNAQTQVAESNAQAISAQTQVAEAQQQVTVVGQTLTPVAATLVAAEVTAAYNASQALSQSLAVNAEQAINNDNYDLALTLALESLRIRPDLTQAQRLVNQLAYSGSRFSFETPVVAVHPQSIMVASADGNSVLVWNTADRAQLYRLDGHTAPITDVVFSPDGLLLASSSEDSSVIVWDVAIGGIKHRLTGHTGKVHAVDFSADAVTLVSGADDNQSILWNAADGVELGRRSFNNPDRPVFRVRFDVTNPFRFYSWEQVGDTVTMMLWDTRNSNSAGTSIQTLFDYNQPMTRYVINTLEPATQLSAYDAASLGRARDFTNVLQRGESVTARAISPVSSVMLAGLANSTPGAVNRLVLLDIASGSVIRPFEGSGAQRVNALAFSPDGRLAASGYGQFLVVWDIESGREVFRLAAHNDLISSIAFSADGRFALTRSRDGNARVWDMTGGDPAQVNTIIAQTQNNRASYPAFSPDGSQVFSTLETDVFSWGALDSGQLNRVFMGDNILSAGYSPTQPYVLTIFPNGARLWDMSRPPAEAQVRPMGAANEQYEEGAAPPAFSPDGQYVVLYGSELAVWEVASNNRVSTLDQSAIKEGDEVLSLAITTDNRFVLGATGDVTTAADAFASDIIVWNAASGQVMTRFGADLHSRTIYDVAVSPDSTQALSASGDNTLILWDIASGRLVRRLAGHRGAVRHVVFLPDGTRALSAGDDATIILWDLTSGQPIRRYSGHTTPINGLALSADGRTFATTTGGESIYIWRLESIDEVLAWTYINRYIQQLSCDEAGQYGLVGNCL